MRQALMAVVLAASFVGPVLVPGADGSTGEFRIEFQATPQPRGALVEGYVLSSYPRATDRMVLRIERLDPSGQVLGVSRTWVAGGTPSAGRAYFSARVAEAASYRVLVESFDWQRCGDG